MKKIFCLLSCILLVLLMIACSGKKKDIQQPVNFYYLNSDISYNTPTGVISAEVREGAEFQNFKQLLEVYLKGPISSELQSLIPIGVKLQSCVIEEDSLNILFSPQFAELSGVKLTAVSSAILLTAHDYLGVQTLCIRVEGSQLDEKDMLVLSMDDIVLSDTLPSEMAKE